jgi:methyl-accepting chemotaxis protein
MRRKLQLLSGSGIAGLIVFAAVAFITVNQIQVGSDFFEAKRLSNSVAADFENPPQSLQKVYSLAVEAEDAPTADERQKLIAQIRDAHQDYETGHTHYAQVLPAGPLHDLVTGDSHAATEAWYLAAEQSFFPALNAGNHAAAEAARTGPMEAAYRRDAAAVDEITQVTNDWDAANDLSAKQLVKLRTRQMLALAVVLLIVLVLLGRSVLRELTLGIDGILRHMEALAACDLSQAIEVRGPEEFTRMLQALEKSIAGFSDAIRSIRTGAQRFAAAAAQMESTSRESASHANTNSQQAQQAAAAIAQMDAAIQEVSRYAGAALDIAKNTETSANHGVGVVGEAVTAVRDIATATDQVETRITSLGEHSAQIGRIVTAIEEIAEQTNLLALNAAIEAARAGEHGRGFGVVAGEVRRLAERTTQATNEVRQMVGAIQQETEATVQAMHSGTQSVEGGVGKTEATVTVLESIRGLAHDSGQQAAQIATSAEQQTSAIREIHTGIDSMADFAGHTLRSTEQAVEACRSLSQLAAELTTQSESFRLPPD